MSKFVQIKLLQNTQSIKVCGNKNIDILRQFKKMYHPKGLDYNILIFSFTSKIYDTTHTVSNNLILTFLPIRQS